MKQRQSRSADDWYQIGDAALRRRRVQEAYDAFERAVEIDPRHANALYRLGEIAQASGNLYEAEGLYGRALSVQPRHKLARERLERIVARPKDRPAQQPSGSEVDGRPPYQPSGAGVVGIVRGLRQISLPTGNWEFRSRPYFDWSFRLERPGTVGEAGRALPVHLRGEQLAGDLREGDWVQLPPDWRPGRYPKQLMNLTTGEPVRAVGVPAATVFVRALNVIGMILIVSFIIYGLLQGLG